jgi:peptidyl-prolyl cis-trans isomerase SurA
MKNTFRSLAVIVAVLSMQVDSQAQQKLLIDKVMAKVGSETILLSEIEAQYSFAVEQSGQSGDDVKCQILEGIMGQKLIVHQARLDSVIVSDEEINSQLDFRINGVLRQMNDDEKFFEEYYGMTVDKMRSNLRDDLEQQLLAERMQAQLMSDVDITPDDVKAFYDLIPQDSLPYLSSEVEFAEIVVKPVVNEAERSKALALAEELLSRINAGENFEELAMQYSADPGSGANGGDLGFAKRGTFVPEFEEAAYNLDINEVSDPVETEFGFHLIKMIEKKGTKINLKHILIKPTITDADIDLANSLLDSVKTLINEEKITFDQAVKKYSLEDIPSYHNNGRVQNPSTGKTFFQTAELPTEVYFAIEDMSVGKVSEVLEYPLPTGDKYYRLVQLQSKTKPHKANLQEDYSKIQELAKQNKKNEFFMRWITEKLKETYIEVDPRMNTCPNIAALIN